MKKILFAISDSFPYGAAYAARTRALCKLFKSAEYQTDVLCDYVSNFNDTNEYGNIYSVSDSPYYGIKKLLLLPHSYGKKLNYLLSKNKYDYVVSRSMFDRFDLVLAITHKHHIPLILESCEWYDIKSFRHGRLDIRYYQFKHCFKKSYCNSDGVIAISRFLENHYKKQGLPVIRIPGIHDIEKLPYRINSRNDNNLNFIFSGNAFGGKEQFSELFIALALVNVDKKNINMHIYGSSKKEIISLLDEKGKNAYLKLENHIIFHGRVPQYEMAKACEQSDFGIFFRPNRRSSHAGFPTKLGEYLAAGTPVITNDTGDISLIVKNGENGFLINSLDINQIFKVFEKCINISEHKYRNMRIASRNSAERLLHYSQYTKEINEFLRRITYHE